PATSARHPATPPSVRRPGCHWHAWRVSRRVSKVIFAVDEDEGDAAVASGTVGPAMVGAALDHDVTGPHHRFADVHYQREFALQHDAIVDGLGAMHEGMAARAARAAFDRCVRGANLGEMGLDLFRRQRIERGIIRRDVEHANAGSALGWHELDALFRGFAGIAVDGRRGGPGVPRRVEPGAVFAADALHSLHGSILLDHGAALRIMTRDDATHGNRLHRVFPPSCSASQSAMKSRAKDMLSAPTCSTPPSRSVNSLSSRCGLLTRPAKLACA